MSGADSMKTLKDLEGRELGMSALIIGAGSSLRNYMTSIDEFIKHNGAYTIGINNIADIIVPDYHTWTNTQRFRTYGHTIHPSSNILLGQGIKLNIIHEVIGSRPYTVINYIERYGMPISYNNGKITGWFRTAGVLSIFIAHIMGASEINVVGMDGYTLYSQKELQDGKGQHCYGTGHTDTADYETCLKKDNQINDALLGLKKYGIKFNILTPTKYEEFYDSSRLHLS
jgi:hypothetical protein